MWINHPPCSSDVASRGIFFLSGPKGYTDFHYYFIIPYCNAPDIQKIEPVS